MWEAKIPPYSSFNIVYWLSNSRESFLKKVTAEVGNSCFSNPLWENLGTYVQERWCYEVFAIYHDLIYELFES